MNILKINDSISKAYRQVPIAKDAIKKFRQALRVLVDNISVQSLEKNQETYLRDFLRDTFYSSCDINKPNDSDIDWAVRLGGRQTPVAIIIENKTLSNKEEMITVNDLNRKAMQELVYYFLEERIEHNNVNIRHLIANNMYEFFVFDAQEFEKNFYQNKKLVKMYKAYKRGELSINTTKELYPLIGSEFINEVQDKIAFTHFDIQSYKSAIESDDDAQLKRLAPLYRLFSDIHLMKLSFQNDNNTLNTHFYVELLHLLGLKEERIDNKMKIIRKPKGDRDKASFLENAINKIDAEDALHNLPNLSKYGDTEEEQIYNVALQLCISWINRLLFLKLLEAQLIKYNKGAKEYKFLTIEKIYDYDELNRLFFQVLARNYEERGEDEQRDFANVPYLNSSLFDVTDLERKVIKISSLSQKENMPLLSNSILKKDERYKKKAEMPTLEYLFAFLDAYNFASENEDEIQDTPKSLISASVLGLIFEKLNGHKDGAIYTPGTITMYMSKEAIRKTVVQKFNSKYSWKCKDFVDLQNKDLDISEANDIIDDLKICDPAVGSGHFLVSALNELLQIKYDLGILVDESGIRISKKDYTFTIEHDELIITDENNDLFIYNKNNKESRRIQKTLFDEKRKLIENCLYGVDLNPNSVNICCLRLWIELLKHSYYTEESGYKYLETLPNIDINIKCGNSLLMQNPLDNEIRQILAGTNLSFNKYNDDVRAYKRTSNKEAKHRLVEDINIIKSTLRHGLSKKSPIYKKWSESDRKLQEYREQSLLFEANKKIQERLKKAEKETAALRKELDSYRENPLYKDAFEWRYEFPEILSKTGLFQGFDCIIGNPPYGVSIKDDYRKGVCAIWKQVPDYEIYYYFIQLAAGLLKDKGYMSYIIPNTWLFNTFAKKYRLKLLENWDIQELLDCTQFNIFKSVTVRNSIVTMQRNSNGCEFIGYRNTATAKSFEELIRENIETISRNDLLELNQNWALAFSRDSEVISLVNRISKNCCQLIDYFPEISQGLIAYDKYRGQSKETIDNRAYHFTEYREGLKKWLWGEDVRRYSVMWNQKEYIDYCDGIANPRQPKFFNGKRLLVREITNPSIYSAIVEDELYNDPSILVVLDNNAYPIDVACAILNSKLATFYHFNHSPKATKGAFPKILIEDIQQFPLPSANEKIFNSIKGLVNEIMHIKKENPNISTLNKEQELDKWIYKLYGLRYEDILIIDPETTIVKEEYEKSKN
ncbi:Eco57I restriction-modification methylase [Prevotellaceae bacterium HUN156]|nr:Eco57I restriction-modification methylase [Prevotellaceae bacterium HUN156]